MTNRQAWRCIIYDMTHRKSEIYIDKCAHLFVILLQIISDAYSYLYSLCFYMVTILLQNIVL